jgi:sulfide:quinone oxidoreductase
VIPLPHFKIGGINATALTKFIQSHDDAQHLKIALISRENIYLQPSLYFPIIHGHVKELAMESSGVSGQVANWSKTEVGVLASKIDPAKNTVSLTNGKTFNYKALVLATGFDHKLEYIRGLEKFSHCHESENVFIHALDHKSRYYQNYWHGYNHKAGDFICYSPKFPYKGEGTDFYALYYESFLRMDKMQQTSSAGARIQFYTPNKEIYQFPYANEVALDECHKRGIDVCFGWEMLEVKKDNHNQKIAVFRNVDSGEIMEKPFFTACINPPSKPHSIIKDSGLGDEHGLVDVNKYTLQHKKYENVFAFGDCIGGDGMTRTHEAA